MSGNRHVVTRDAATGQIPIPAVPSGPTDSASKAYVDSEVAAGVGTALDTEIIYNNGGVVDGNADLTFDGEVLSIGTPATTVGATQGLSIGTGNTLSAERGFASGMNNTVSGRDAFASGDNNTASNSRAWVGGQNSEASGVESFCWGDGSTAGPGAHTYVLGDQAEATASGGVVIGHGVDNSAIECITISANDSADAKPSLSQTNESIVCYARNLDAYDDAFRIVAGDDLALQECSVKDHNSTLTWSYTPTTAGDWSVVPADVGSALDTLATATSTVVTSGTWTPTTATGANVTTATPALSEYIRVGDVVSISTWFTVTTGAGAVISQFSFTLPINRGSAFTTSKQLQICGSGLDGIVAVEPIVASGFSGNNICFLSFINTSGGVNTYNFAVAGKYNV